MGSQVRVLYCPPSSRTKKDIYAKNPEVSTASGFFLRPFFEVEKKDIKKGFGKISGLEPLPTRFWAAFPGIFRESGSFLLSAKCRILAGVFVGVAECALQAQMPAR